MYQKSWDEVHSTHLPQVKLPQVASAAIKYYSFIVAMTYDINTFLLILLCQHRLFAEMSRGL